MSDSQKRGIAPLLKVMLFESGYFHGSLVKAVGKVFKVDVSDMLPFAIEKNKIPKSVPPYHELISAAMYVHRCYQDERPCEMAIQYLASGIAEWADDGKIPDELEEVVRRHIKDVFLKYAQNLSRASEALKISRNTLRKYVQEGGES